MWPPSTAPDDRQSKSLSGPSAPRSPARLMTHRRDTYGPFIHAPCDPLHRRRRQLTVTGDGGLSTSRRNPARQHGTSRYRETTGCICDGAACGGPPDIVIMMQQKQNERTERVFFRLRFPPPERSRPHALVFAGRTGSSGCRAPRRPLCYTPHDRCALRSSRSRNNDGRRAFCRPVNAFAPRNPRHETNKHLPRDTLAIHSHLHGYVLGAAKTPSLCNANEFLQRLDKTTASSLWAGANTNMNDSFAM